MTADFSHFFYEKQCKPLGLRLSVENKNMRVNLRKPLGLRLLRKSLRDAILRIAVFVGVIRIYREVQS